MTGNSFSINYGSAAGTTCQGNDSRLSNARQASDVYAWAKANTKPVYTYSEVGAAASSHTHTYLPLAGGTISGNLAITGNLTVNGITNLSGELYIYKNICLQNSNGTDFYSNAGPINLVKYSSVWATKSKIILSDSDINCTAPTINNTITGVDNSAFVGLSLNSSNTINTSGANFFKINNNSTDVLKYTRKYNGYDTYDLIMAPWSSIQASNRLDFYASQIFFNSSTTNYQCALGLSRIGDASSTATQKNSYPIVMQNSMWNGTSNVFSYNSIKSVASTTVNGNNRLAFSLNTDYVGNGGTEAMSLSSTGVTINADWNNDYEFRIAEGNSDVYGAYFKYGLNDSIKIGTYNNSTTGTDAIRISRGSNNVSIVGDLNTGGNITATGEITAYSASDKRLKKNIKPLSNSLDIINKLNPVSYNWNDKAKKLNINKNDNVNYGLIAQELAQITPELVHPIYNEYKSIDYIQLIPLLISAIKEQQEQINELNSKINKQK